MKYTHLNCCVAPNPVQTIIDKDNKYADSYPFRDTKNGDGCFQNKNKNLEMVGFLTMGWSVGRRTQLN